jgi:hypothetical protein
LTDGRLIPGVISHEGSFHIVTQPLGVIRFPDRVVEKTFRSIPEAYQYKREQLPESDPGEHLKLARWCLGLDLKAEAKEQLLKVLQISPEHGPAKAMLANLEQSEVRMKRRTVDPAVKQTRAEEEVAEDRLGALDSAVLRGAQRGLGIADLPVIFDLPRPLAVRRAEEFAVYVHPVLQAYCAKCHDGEYEGSFQLVPIKSRRQQTPGALRTNLDATLRLIDPENPAKSELLSSTLRPHGHGPKKRPLFPGSNNQAYQILAAWVNSLRSPKTGEGSTRLGGERAGSGRAETFAADRERTGGVPMGAEIPGPAMGHGRTTMMSGGSTDASPGPAYRYLPGRGMVVEDPHQVDPREFPLPVLLGGPKPAATGRSLPAESRRPNPRPTATDGTPASSASPIGDAASPGRAGAGSTPKVSSPEAEASADTGAAKKSGKPLKIDPAILERALRNRNAVR